MRLIIALSLCICLAFACDQLWSSSVVPCGQPGLNCPPGFTPPGQDLSQGDDGVLRLDMTGQPEQDMGTNMLSDASGLELPPPPVDLLDPEDMDMIASTAKDMIVSDRKDMLAIVSK
jgi:hypothetical protein